MHLSLIIQNVTCIFHLHKWCCAIDLSVSFNTKIGCYTTCSSWLLTSVILFFISCNEHLGSLPTLHQNEYSRIFINLRILWNISKNVTVGLHFFISYLIFFFRKKMELCAKLIIRHWTLYPLKSLNFLSTHERLIKINSILGQRILHFKRQKLHCHKRI